MPIDFTSLEQTTEHRDDRRHPRDVFSSLSRSDKYDYLRGPQDQVLDQWHERRSESDLVIKLNTGGGKTVVGLLIAQCSLEEGRGPVAYLVPDHNLAKQVREEATSLGITVTEDPGSYDYGNSQAILVDVFPKLLNGQSVFGVNSSSPKQPRYSIGTIIIDDVHASLAKAEETFRLRIPSDTEAYADLLELFSDVLEQQSPTALLDIHKSRQSALLQIPYWAWQERQREVLQIIHPLTDDNPHIFSWPLIADVLPLCRAVFTSEAVEIGPEHLPIDVLTGFANAFRRIYLTATLADDGVLIENFDADPETISKPITPANAGDIGDRLILSPQEINPSVSEETVREFIVDLASERNVVVIVPSEYSARIWEDLGAEVLNRDTIQEGLKNLRSNPQHGLVVLVNRYDGIDLPGPACHVLVLDGLPQAAGPLDRLDEAQLTGSPALLRRQIQRLEQGMGRSVRSSNDHSVVLLMGTRLTEHMLRRGAEDALSPATRAQIHLSREVAQQLRGESVEKLEETILQILDRDENWIKLNRRRLADLRYPQTTLSPVITKRRQAFDEARQGLYEEASMTIQAALNEVTSDQSLRGKLLQEKASYQYQINPVDSQKTQRAANKANRTLFRPEISIDYTKIATPTQQQGIQASSWLQSSYSSGDHMQLGFKTILDDLKLGQGMDAKRFEAALDKLAFHLGFVGQRPGEENKRGPDNLWALNDGTFLVIEAKNRSETLEVSKDYVVQLSGSMDWFRANYPASSATPVLVHPQAKFDSKATAPQGCRVITEATLPKLRNAIREIASALNSNNAFRDPKQVTKLLAHHALTSQGFLLRYSEAARHQK